MQQGYLTFEGIDCVYTKLDESFIVSPINTTDRTKMYSLAHKKNFILEYEHYVYKKSFAFVEKIESRFDNTFEFTTKFIANLTGEHGISELLMAGDELDLIFSPVEHFYQKRQKAEEIGDVLYNRVESEVYQFNFLDQPITMSLSYGDLLRKGIASDLRLQTLLHIQFKTTTNLAFIYTLYKMMVKFCQLMVYRKSYNLKPMELYGNVDSKRVSIGRFYVDPFKTKARNGFHNYGVFKPYVCQLIQLVAEDETLYLRHLPDKSNQLYKYSVLRYLSVVAAFESECKKNPEEYSSKDDENIREIKDSIIATLQSMDPKNDDEELYLHDAKSYLGGLGKQLGLKRKIVNAFMKQKHFFEDSMVNFPTQNTINDVAKDLATLRHLIAHDNLDRSLTDEEQKNIRFLDILTYILLLQRAEIDDNGVELIIGVVFLCNSKYLDK